MTMKIALRLFLMAFVFSWVTACSEAPTPLVANARTAPEARLVVEDTLEDMWVGDVNGCSSVTKRFIYQLSNEVTSNCKEFLGGPEWNSLPRDIVLIDLDEGEVWSKNEFRFVLNLKVKNPEFQPNPIVVTVSGKSGAWKLNSFQYDQWA
jgi:hypothetical protein